MNKNLMLVLGVIFLVLSIIIFSFINMTITDEMTGISPDRRVYIFRIVILCLGTSVLGLSLGLFYEYYRTVNNPIIIGVIPVRMSSSRFPGKPLAKINKIPMVEHVYRNCKECKALTEVYIATPDKEIKDYMELKDAKVIMTSNEHRGATDRVAEALLKIEDIMGKKVDYIVLVQGDEPMITSNMIYGSLVPVLEENCYVSNLMFPLSKEDAMDKNEIKVTVDKNGYASNFSRNMLIDGPYFKQVCCFAFKRETLLKYKSLKPSPLEILESVDMLRFLENDIPIKMVETDIETYSVDTEEDLKFVEKLMEVKKNE